VEVRPEVPQVGSAEEVATSDVAESTIATSDVAESASSPSPARDFVEVPKPSVDVPWKVKLEPLVDSDDITPSSQEKLEESAETNQEASVAGHTTMPPPLQEGEELVKVKLEPLAADSVTKPSPQLKPPTKLKREIPSPQKKKSSTVPKATGVPSKPAATSKRPSDSTLDTEAKRLRKRMVLVDDIEKVMGPTFLEDSVKILPSGTAPKSKKASAVPKKRSRASSPGSAELEAEVDGLQQREALAEQASKSLGVNSLEEFLKAFGGA